MFRAVYQSCCWRVSNKHFIFATHRVSLQHVNVDTEKTYHMVQFKSPSKKVIEDWPGLWVCASSLVWRGSSRLCCSSCFSAAHVCSSFQPLLKGITHNKYHLWPYSFTEQCLDFDKLEKNSCDCCYAVPAATAACLSAAAAFSHTLHPISSSWTPKLATIICRNGVWVTIG